MVRTKNAKRSSLNTPRVTLVDKRQCTTHRGYTKISNHNDDHNRLIMNFSLKVAKYIMQQSLTTTPKNNSNNVVCSPLSMDAVLNVIALGAKGATLEQLLELTERNGVHDFNAMAAILANVVKDSKGEGGAEISFANGLWVDQRFPLKASFQQVMIESHKGEARVVDFHSQVDEVVNEVNLWVEKQSKGLIKQIVSKNAISKRIVMLLVNALYFKGTWVDKFKTENTKEGDFYLLNGTKVRVPFMYMGYMSFEYGTLEGCQVLRMLYEEEENVQEGEKTRSFSMYIFLPREKDGLPNLFDEIQMDSSLFKDKIELKYQRIDELLLPKFEFDCDLSLTEPMKQLGLTLPFNEECEDLTGFVDSPTIPTNEWLYVTNIIQKCRIEVNEEGTKVVAFTRPQLHTGAARRTKPRPPPVNFVADHPFLFMIREDISGAILFVGTQLNPLSS